MSNPQKKRRLTDDIGLTSCCEATLMFPYQLNGLTLAAMDARVYVTLARDLDESKLYWPLHHFAYGPVDYEVEMHFLDSTDTAVDYDEYSTNIMTLMEGNGAVATDFYELTRQFISFALNLASELEPSDYIDFRTTFGQDEFTCIPLNCTPVSTSKNSSPPCKSPPCPGYELELNNPNGINTILGGVRRGNSHHLKILIERAECHFRRVVEENAPKGVASLIPTAKTVFSGLKVTLETVEAQVERVGCTSAGLHGHVAESFDPRLAHFLTPRLFTFTTTSHLLDN